MPETVPLTLELLLKPKSQKRSMDSPIRYCLTLLGKKEKRIKKMGRNGETF